MSRVAFAGVTKRFGETIAVDRLDLEIHDNEFMVLLGPSGCGKTTALRLVAGLDAVSEGDVFIGDRVVNDIEAKDRNIAMVFQSYALYPHMTVAKNIESPLVARSFVDDTGTARKLHAEERRARVVEAAETLGLTGLLDRKPAALSGGQRQRVALARAIVSRPNAFLMDEPLSNLDAKLRAQTRLELVDLQKSLATTVLYVTHDQVEAMTMATRIAILNEGRLQQVGPPQQVYEQPDNLFVARFIGSPPMNTFTGVLREGDGQGVVDVGESGRILVDAVPAVLPASRRIIVGVRPEHLHITTAEDGGVGARVTAVEWLGHERHIVCDAGGELVTLRQPSDEPAPAAGELLRLAPDPAHVVLFDPDSSERLR